ncbi:6-phosphogluconate dehydrogenase [Cucurbitaria berberidis CBS 394.84]|uniref:6-phosphogluconate dehydrogenase n=1 Tax=Cucurbitaria berberidis CBS 394.84 TaxID=1168544 RepID=A0A9P4GFU8_9PLEO|nr:6-phosphogluconate dehydrogenase [Cucurbitaria berberidis CBS 394.84]KAF1845298.1 6-phosphogluconate dehydrogenase [Cucurbitaria berberidis CBS 394.84]
MSSPQLGWIGLGSMGIGMSKNLQKHLSSSSFPALVYTNRTLSRGDSLKDLGAIPLESVDKVARKSDIIFSCVSNDAVLQAVVDEIIASGDITGKVCVDCSTVHPDTSKSVLAKITRAGAHFIAAPVFGASPMAEAGKLIFVVAGRGTAKTAITPYLKNVMGRSVIDLGEDVTKSSLLKIAGNVCVVSFMEVISEAHVFAEKTGLGSEILEQMLGDMFGPVIESYSKRLTSGNYAPPPNGKAGFDVSLAIKDAKHALNCAEAAGTRIKVSEIALSHLERARELQPQRPLDSGAIYGTIRSEAGLDFLTDLCKSRDSSS